MNKSKRTGTIAEWERFRQSFSPDQLRLLDGASDLDIAIREEDYVRAQEIATRLILGTSDYPPSLKGLMDL